MAQLPNLHTDASNYQAGMGGWSKTLAPLFIEFISCIKEGDRVLDVVCGTGSLTFTIADTTKASKVVGIDPSVGYLEYARAHNTHPHVTFELGDAQKLPYDDDSFDCCVSSLMMQFVPDGYKAAREMRRVTKKGELLQLVCGTLVEAWSYRKDSGMLPLQLTRELNDLGITVMDQQARFQICGPPPALRKLNQRPWLFLWSLVPLRIYGAFSRTPKDR